MICKTQITMKRTTILGLLIATLLIPALAKARVISVQMSAPTTAFGGYSWPGVGTYDKITGVAYAEVDPADPRNAIIVDIGLAQTQPGAGQPGKTPGGKVAYLLNFYILKPHDLNAVDHSLNGYGKVMYEPPNRGGKTWTALGRVTGGGNDPASITDPTILANSFLMPRGYTLVWSGWEPLVSLANLGTSLTASVALPIAQNPGPTTITGPAYEYIVTGANSFTLAYAAANSADTTTAKLTHRVHLDDPATMTDVIPAWGSAGCNASVARCWEYTSAAGTAIRLVLPSTHAAVAFTGNDIYEFFYTAKDPWVAGLGFAAVRDWNSWLRYETQDNQLIPTLNPLRNYITRIYTEISSQPGRMLNDFDHLGFNEDESGRKVLDGHMQWIAAGSGIGMNYRFSQSGRTERNRQDHLYPENLFPFANVTTTDPFTHITDSRYAKCQSTGTCPFAVEIYSGNEYWVKTASLLHISPDGMTDLSDSPYTRNYFMSSMMHGGAAFPIGDPSTLASRIPGQGACQQRTNPLNSAPVQRALFLALDKWATMGIPAPASRVPRLSDGTAVLPKDTGFPTDIPDPFNATPNHKVTYTGLKTSRYRFDLGPDFYTTGIPTKFPADITPPLMPLLTDSPVPVMSTNGPVYPSFVPKTDSDGNDIPGVRLPDVTVPLATYTGWALRSGVWANDGCEGSGQFIPFPKTQVDRLASSDPRLSVAERYLTFADYDNKVINAMNAMIQDRTLLCEDAPSERDRLRSRAADFGVPGAPTSTALLTPYSFPLANTSVASLPNSLWPPNGKMAPVSVEVSVADNCNASCRIVGVSGNDGASEADWQITGPLTAMLRSKRSGNEKNGRTYTLTLQCTDDAGMTSTKTVSVNVPHDQGK
jgi:alpha/beta hydrolase family protein